MVLPIHHLKLILAVSKRVRKLEPGEIVCFELDRKNNVWSIEIPYLAISAFTVDHVSLPLLRLSGPEHDLKLFQMDSKMFSV